MSLQCPDVPAWLERVRLGDDDAARALVEHLYPLVLKIVRSHRARRLAEEDLAQEVFLKMFNRLNQYRGQDGVPFEHWLSRLAVTTCLDALRAEKRRPEWRWADLGDAEREWADFLLGEKAAPPNHEQESAREMVGQLLASLEPEDRLVLTLLDLEDRSVAEVTQLTGWNGPLVKIRAFRARRKLRKQAEQLRRD